MGQTLIIVKNCCEVHSDLATVYTLFQNKEMVTARREIEMLKEAVQSLENKNKATNQKLKTEQDSHKVCSDHLSLIRKNVGVLPYH